MNENKITVGENKAKEFVKKHKKHIFLAALTVAGGIAVAVITKRVSGSTLKCEELKFDPVPAENLAKPTDWWVGELTELWREGEFTNMIASNVPISKLGEFGQECLKIDGVSPDTVVDLVVGLE